MPHSHENSVRPLSNNVLIVCIGNELVGDDAVGWHIYRKLIGRSLPSSVQLLFLSVGGFELIDLLTGQDLLIVIDAVRFGNAPGTISILEGDDLPFRSDAAVSIHGIGLKEALDIASSLAPETKPNRTIFIGVEGRNFDELGSEMHECVVDAIQPTMDTVIRILKQSNLIELSELS